MSNKSVFEHADTFRIDNNLDTPPQPFAQVARGLADRVGDVICHVLDGVFGYRLGKGGAVTQATDSTTAVTLNTATGQITTVALTTAAAAEEVFTVNNSKITAKDVPLVSTTYDGAGTPAVTVKAVADGSFKLVITNLHASAALNAAVVINFALFKGQNS